MKTIRYRHAEDDSFSYPGDVDRIVQAFESQGLYCTPEMANTLWHLYSDSMSAGWLFLPEEDSDVVECLRPYFEEDKELE